MIECSIVSFACFSYTIMTSCWALEPKLRPAFSVIARKLEVLLDSEEESKL